MRSRILYILFAVACLCIFIQACQSEEEIAYARYYVNGKGLYEKYCQNCHAADGSGLKNLYPPLTDSLFLRDNQDKLACIVKYGLSDTIKINGQIYDGKMPANPELTDIDVAQILVYIGNSFGNNLGNFDLKEVSSQIKECR